MKKYIQKTKTGLLIVVGLLLLAEIDLFAQRLRFGPEIGYLTDMKIRFAPTQVGNAIISPTYANNQFYDGYRIGLFAERQMLDFVDFKASLGYSETFGGGITYEIHSLSTPPATRWARGLALDHRMVDIYVTGGITPFPKSKKVFFRNMQIQLGVGYWRFGVLGKKPLTLLPEEVGTLEPVLIENESRRYQYAVEQSFLENVLLWRLGVILPITNRLFVEGTFERTLSPVGKELKYRDVAYQFEQNTQRVVISVGYRFGAK